LAISYTCAENVIKSRPFAKGQKIFVVMVIFVCCLLFFANAVAFNLISAPLFVNEIIAYLALTVAVTLTIITIASVIRDKRKSLSPKTQKPNVVNSSKESIETPSMILSPVDSQENTDKGYLNPSGVQTANESDKSTVTPMAKSSRKRKLFVIIMAFIVGLLFFANTIAFSLIALPEYSMYAAMAGAIVLTAVLLVVALAGKRRGVSAKIQKARVVNAVKESNEPLEKVPSSVDFQESKSVVETDGADIQTINVLDEAQISAFPKAKFVKKRNVLIFIIAIAVGFLFFANCVAFGLISLPGYFAYAFVAGASALAIITVALALGGKQNGALSKAPIGEVVGAIEKPTISQTSVDMAVQTANESDKAPFTPMTKSSRKRSLVAILIAIIVGLLLYVNVVAFNLIVLPEYTIYVALAVVAALIITTIAIALFDKPKSTILKTPIEDVVSAIQESNAPSELPDTVSLPTIAQTSLEKIESDIGAIETAKVPDEKSASIARIGKVFGKRSLFVIIVALTVGLLFFANAVAFGLISLPEYSMYAAVAGAVAIVAIAVTIILIEKIKILGEKIKKFVSEPQIREIINEVKETYQAPDTAPTPVIAQTSTKKVDSYAELLRQFSVQKNINKLEVDKAEQEKPLPKKPVIPPTKVICPACRKEFSLPIYEKDLIVDFGSPKQSNTIKECPHCRTPMRLKRKGTVEEDIWKE
jgi:hypothetical protein